MFSYVRGANASQLFERRRILESQADNLASVLLMPRWMVVQALTVYGGDEPVIQYGGCCFSCNDKLVIQNMADELGVSFTAMIIRLKKLGYVEYRSLEEYISNVLVFGGDAV